jgi:hypothetical protein
MDVNESVVAPPIPAESPWTLAPVRALVLGRRNGRRRPSLHSSAGACASDIEELAISCSRAAVGCAIGWDRKATLRFRR